MSARRYLTLAVSAIAVWALIFFAASWACLETAQFFGVTSWIGVSDIGTFTFHRVITLVLVVIAMAIAFSAAKTSYRRFVERPSENDGGNRLV